VGFVVVLEAHLTGQFPRSEELVEATRSAVRGQISQSDLERTFRKDLAGLAQLQIQAGLSYMVDGQLNWQDLFRPFSTLFSGVGCGGLMRWFDNNTFYRRPIIVGKVELADTDMNQFFRSNLLPDTAPKKAVLPGPFTFALMSQNNTDNSFADLVDDIAHALKELVARLLNNGYKYFQFDEPSLCTGTRTENELEIARQGLETCSKGIDGKTAIQTYFGDGSAIIGSVLDYPIDCIGLDFYATSLAALRDYSFEKEIACGCIDGRNSLLESPEESVRFVEKVREELKPKSVSVCPNCDLAFLPHSIAEAKVRLLSEIIGKWSSHDGE
jgi:5-methyltetrahydropteroyltriglutamate--homocysteine methyltransferase